MLSSSVQLEEYLSLLFDIIKSQGLFGIIDCVGPTNRLRSSQCFCKKWKHRAIMEKTSWLSKQIHLGLKTDLRSLSINTEILMLLTKKKKIRKVAFKKKNQINFGKTASVKSVEEIVISQ